MSQRVAACCCQACSDPTLGGCCIQKGTVCTCEPNKTICECTKLGGVWNANPVCPDSCLGACCVTNASGYPIRCIDNTTKCNCDALNVGQQTSIFQQGKTCANASCSSCLAKPHCPQNKILNIELMRAFSTSIISYNCDNIRGAGSGYNSSSFSSEASYDETVTFQDPCLQLFVRSRGFVIYDPNDPYYVSIYNNCISTALSITVNTTQTIYEDDGITVAGTIDDTYRASIQPFAQIVIPPCGIWVAAGTYHWKATSFSHSCACFQGCPFGSTVSPQYDTTDVYQYYFPVQDTFFIGCNGTSDIPNPFSGTAVFKEREIFTTKVPNQCQPVCI